MCDIYLTTSTIFFFTTYSKNVEVFIIIKDYDFEINSQKIRAVKNKDLYFLIFKIFTILFIINLLTLFIFVNEITYQM